MKYTIIFLCLFFSMFFLVACDSTYIVLAKENIAEVRENIYIGSNDKVNISFMSGLREENYVVNGYCTKNIEFGVITVKFIDSIDVKSVPIYIINIGLNRYDGVLEKNPFDETWCADIKRKTNENISIKITCNNESYSLILTNVSDKWNIKHDEALNLGLKQMIFFVKELKINSKFEGEIYVKIILDDEYEDIYYWYVKILSRTGDYNSVVIDVNSGEILVEKNID